MHTHPPWPRRRQALVLACGLPLAAGLATISRPAPAQPLPTVPPLPAPPLGDYTTMRGLAAPGGRLRRMNELWHGQFLVEISAMSSTTIALPPGGAAASISFNPRPLVMSAMASWSRSRVPIRLMRAGEVPSMRIRIGVLAEPNMLGWTNALGRTYEVTISLDAIGRAASSSYQWMISLGYLPSHDVSFQDYANMLAQLTILHEMGHALGLGHTGETLLPANSNFTVVLQRTLGVMHPSIMTDSYITYFRLFYELQRRPAVPGDVELTSRDRDAAGTMWDGGATTSAVLDALSCVAPVDNCVSR